METAQIEAIVIPKRCPDDATVLEYQELDFLPGYFAWVCPECGYIEF